MIPHWGRGSPLSVIWETIWRHMVTKQLPYDMMCLPYDGYGRSSSPVRSTYYYSKIRNLHHEINRRVVAKFVFKSSNFNNRWILGVIGIFVITKLEKNFFIKWWDISSHTKRFNKTCYVRICHLVVNIIFKSIFSYNYKTNRFL